MKLNKEKKLRQNKKHRRRLKQPKKPPKILTQSQRIKKKNLLTVMLITLKIKNNDF